jgi:hypothetical protein
VLTVSYSWYSSEVVDADIASLFDGIALHLFLFHLFLFHLLETRDRWAVAKAIWLDSINA